MSWFRRSQQEPPDPSDRSPAQTIGTPAIVGRCWAAGCSTSEVYPCSYTDSGGFACPTQWCQTHVGAFQEGKAFCRRHHRVAHSLADISGSVLDHRLPDLNDRGYGLLLLLVNDLNDRMLDMLRERFADMAQSEAAVDGSVRLTRRGSEVAWEHGWAAYLPTGFLARVVLRIAKQEPPTVQILINHQPAIEMVPDWIARRPTTTLEDQKARAAFLHRIMGAVDSALR